MDISTSPSGPWWPCPQLPQQVLWVVCLAKLRPGAGAWQPGAQGSTLPSSPWENPLTWEGCSEVRQTEWLVSAPRRQAWTLGHGKGAGSVVAGLEPGS